MGKKKNNKNVNKNSKSPKEMQEPNHMFYYYMPVTDIAKDVMSEEKLKAYQREQEEKRREHRQAQNARMEKHKKKIQQSARKRRKRPNLKKMLLRSIAICELICLFISIVGSTLATVLIFNRYKDWADKEFTNAYYFLIARDAQADRTLKLYGSNIHKGYPTDRQGYYLGGQSSRTMAFKIIKDDLTNQVLADSLAAIDFTAMNEDDEAEMYCADLSAIKEDIIACQKLAAERDSELYIGLSGFAFDKEGNCYPEGEIRFELGEAKNQNVKADDSFNMTIQNLTLDAYGLQDADIVKHVKLGEGDYNYWAYNGSQVLGNDESALAEQKLASKIKKKAVYGNQSKMHLFQDCEFWFSQNGIYSGAYHGVISEQIQKENKQKANPFYEDAEPTTVYEERYSKDANQDTVVVKTEYEVSKEDQKNGTFDESATAINERADKVIIDGCITINMWAEYGKYYAFAWCILLIFPAIICGFVTYRNYERDLYLYQSEQYRRTTTNALAHDLKTPLMVMSGYLENMQEETDANQKRYYMDKVQNKIGYMNGLIEDILQLSKLEQPELKLDIAEFAVAPVVESCISEVEPLLRQKGLVCEIQEADKMMMKADEKLFSRMMNNIVQNAAKYAKDNSKIVIKLNSMDAIGGSIVVQNESEPLTMEFCQKAFEPFVKGEDARSGSNGTGIGLSVGKQIADSHGMDCRMTYESGVTSVSLYMI